jgi:hypothetical protein
MNEASQKLLQRFIKDLVDSGMGIEAAVEHGYKFAICAIREQAGDPVIETDVMARAANVLRAVTRYDAFSEDKDGQ